MLPWPIERQHEPYYNTQSSFSNIRPSFWFSLKPSKAWPSVLKAKHIVPNAQPRVLKQMFDQGI